MNNRKIAERIAGNVLHHITKPGELARRTTAGLTEIIEEELDAIDPKVQMDAPASHAIGEEPGIAY